MLKNKGYLLFLNRYKRLVKIFILLLICLLTFKYFMRPKPKAWNVASEQPYLSAIEEEVTPVILVWGGFEDELNYKNMNEGMNDCPLHKCKVIYSKSLYKYDIIIIHYLRLVDFFQVYKARRKTKDLKKSMIIHSLEPPWKLNYQNSRKHLFDRAKQSFNVYISNYLDGCSIVYKYGVVRKLDVPTDITSKIEREFAIRKSEAFSAISDCTNEYFDRLAFIEHLRPHFPVKLVGLCVENKIDGDQFTDNLKAHKFFLSLENAICEDYITEKFWTPLQWGMIPVVYGELDYGRVAPKGSYIDIKKFRDFQELGKYLHYVSNNLTAYLEYFKWKYTHFTVRNGFPEYDNKHCSICELAYNTVMKNHKYDMCSDRVLDNALCKAGVRFRKDTIFQEL